VIGLLQSPAKRVIAALLYHHEKLAAGADATVPVGKEVKAVAEEKPAAAEATPVAEAEAKPTAEVETKPSDDAETKPADDAATKPAEE